VTDLFITEAICLGSATLTAEAGDSDEWRTNRFEAYFMTSIGEFNGILPEVVTTLSAEFIQL